MLVSKTLRFLLQTHIKLSGTAIWYDPDRDYDDFVHNLAPEDLSAVAILRYVPDQGFLALRRALEPYWNEEQPPKLVVYVPLARAETAHALVEFEVGGVVLEPGKQPPELDSSLAAIARQALPQLFPPAKVEELVAQVEARQLSLVELDNLAEKGLEGQSGVIAALFGSGNAADVALRFLANDAIDPQIAAKNAAAALTGLLGEAFGVTFPADKGLPALRLRLARHILLTDLVVALGKDLPQQLATFPLAERPVAHQAAVKLAHQWRNQLDTAASYRELARQIEGEIGLSVMDIPLSGLARVETFQGAETQLQASVEEALTQKATARLLSLAEKRLQGFWAGQDPLIKTRWEVIVAAGRVLLEASRVAAALKSKQWSAEALIGFYAYGQDNNPPWCLLDTAQRHLERDYHRFDLDQHEHKMLLQLVARARQHYASTAASLASRFIHAYADAKFELPRLTAQADIFHQTIATASENGPTAYLLVDAFRYEMARELVTVLDPAWSAELTPAIATPPTITDVGMAALMPGAEKGLTLTESSSGKLAPVVAGKTLRTRQERIAHFEKAASGKAVTAKLEQIAPLTSNHLAKQLQNADLILVTATEEIDGLCETNPSLARRMLDDVLNQLRRGIKTLMGQGINRVVITADHGYLFGEAISSGQTIDPPGGHTVALKRRVWIGKGGATIPGTLRQPLSAFGTGGDLELVTPASLAIFKVPGGSTTYFHGGLSLQELIIPSLTVTSGVTQPPETGDAMAWELSLGSTAITTRFLSVTVAGRSTYLLPVVPPAVRVEVRAGDEIISVPVSATYGFQEPTKDVQLQTVDKDPRQITSNTITLQITGEPAVSTVTVHLLDATTGVSLQRIDQVPFDITL